MPFSLPLVLYVWENEISIKARVSEWKGECLAVKKKIDINYIIVVFSVEMEITLC